MEIYDEIEIIDLALKYKNILIIGDVQLGYEESMSKKGYLIPKFNLEEIIKRLDKIFEKVKVEKIIINGDIKHEFGGILKQEWDDILRFIDSSYPNCTSPIISMFLYFSARSIMSIPL